MAHRKGFPRGRGSSRRKTAWTVGPGGVSATPVLSSSSGFIGSASQPLVEGLTVARIRGLFSVVLNVATAAGAGFQGAVGIGIATLPAIVAGIGSVPTPIAEADSENWLWWHVLSVHAGDATAGSRNWMSAAQDVVIDSKAMRKNPSDMGLYAAFEVTEIGTADIDIFLDTRVLDFLP